MYAGAKQRVAAQPSKIEERQLMRELKDRRERATPQHHSPSWLHAFWRSIGS